MSEGGVAADIKEGPVGLGGWLLLPMLGLFAAPLIGLAGLVDFSGLKDAWPYLTAVQASFIVIELVLNAILLFVAPIMFKRLEIFPGWYMIWLAAAPIIVIADAMLGKAIFPEMFAGEDVFDKDTVRNIGRSIISAAIWIPYTMRSERVANTFVR